MLTFRMMDPKAKFRLYVEPHTRTMIVAAFRFTGNRFDAEDLAQETLFKAYKNIDKLTDYTNPKGWVFTIMKNTFYNNVRYNKHRELPLLDESATDRVKDESHENATSGELSDEMQSSLNTLPEDMRLILIAREVQGFDYNEISQSLGVPLGTVKSRLKRAREKLKKNWFEKQGQK